MVRRRVIRGLALMPLTFCVAAWLESYRCQYTATYAHHPFAVRFIFNYGSITFSALDAWNRGPEPLVLERGEPSRLYARSVYAETAHHGIGFAYEFAPHYLFVVIPLWFPTVVAASLLGLIWRKRRPQYNGKGFPIQVGPKNAPQP
jgi:hypothetical protein